MSELGSETKVSSETQTWFCTQLDAAGLQLCWHSRQHLKAFPAKTTQMFLRGDWCH